MSYYKSMGGGVILAPVYVNGDIGNDANDGDTAATAVKTIGRALELAANRGASNINSDTVEIFIAGGTYNENVYVQTRATFSAQGTVRIVGSLGVNYNGFLTLYGGGSYGYEIIAANTDLAFYAFAGGVCLVNAPVSVTLPAGQATHSCIAATEGGVLYIISDVTASAPATPGGFVLHAYGGGSIIFSEASSFTIDNATNTAHAIASTSGSRIMFYGKVQAITINGAYTVAVAAVNNCGLIFIHPQIATVQGNASGVRYGAYSAGVIDVQGLGPNRIPGTQPGVADPNSYSYYG